MKPPFGVVDADGHINEPEARLMEFPEPPYRDQLHAWVPDQKGSVNPNVTLSRRQVGTIREHGGRS